MQTIALSPAKAAFVAHWQTSQQPKPQKTLADLDELQDFSELDQMIRDACGPYCKWIEFHNDGLKYGERTLEYRVCVPIKNGRVEYSEDGAQPDSDDWQEVIFVKVKPTTTLRHIAGRFQSEVNGIEGNLFAD